MYLTQQVLILIFETRHLFTFPASTEPRIARFVLWLLIPNKGE